jgi:hypothetical protein
MQTVSMSCALCLHPEAIHVHAASELLAVVDRKDVCLCDTCSALVRGKKKTLQPLIEYVTYGTPCNLTQPQIVRWSESPLLANNARVQAIRRLDPCFGASATCLVRWLFEGAPHVFSDFEYGKNIRRIATASSSIWQDLPDACRRCTHGSVFQFGCTYTEAILFGTEDAMKREFQDVIERQPIVPGITFFCTQCRAVSSISFEYDCALRTALFLPQAFATPHAYYVSIAGTHRLKKRAVAQQ